MRNTNGRLTFAATAILAMTALAQASVPTNGYLVTVDTSSVNGQTGAIDLQFNAGALTSENACVTISNFSSDGTLGTAPAPTSTVTGTLDTSLTINNGPGGCSTPAVTYTSSTVNEYTQPITFGNTLSFFVVLNGPGVTAPVPGTYNSGSSFGVAFTDGGAAALTGDASNFAGTITLNPDGSATTAGLAGPGNTTSLVTIQAAELVTVGTLPTGRSFTVDTKPYTADQTFAWAIGSQHTLAVTSPQGTNGTRYTFSKWSDQSTSISDTVTVATGTTTYTANFDTSYLLTTAASPSAEGSVGVGTASPTGDGYYPASTVVNLTATPASSGYKFVNWTGNVADANNASTTVTMSAPESVTANFAENDVNVTVGTSVAGLSYTVDSVPFTASHQFTWQVGTLHTIATTSPQGSNGTRYTFTGWSDGLGISHQVTASSSVTSYTASFSTSYLLTVGVTPSTTYGTVGVSSTSTPVSGYYPAGAQVTLTATPASVTYKFVNWTGTTTTTTNPLTVTMNSPVSETANFTLNQISVTVGTNVSGLSFSVDGTTYTASKMLTWTIGDMHTIATTTPQILAASGGYAFSSWSDSGAISHTVTAAAATTSYTATFNQTATSVTVTQTLRAIGYNKNTRVSSYNYTITNNSKTTIAGPIQVVLLTPNDPGVNNSGIVQGHPYWTINASIPPKNTVGVILEVVTPSPSPMLTLGVYSGHF